MTFLILLVCFSSTCISMAQQGNPLLEAEHELLSLLGISGNSNQQTTNQQGPLPTTSAEQHLSPFEPAQPSPQPVSNLQFSKISSCTCTPRHQCGDSGLEAFIIPGSSSSSLAALVDIRLQDERCNDPNEVCCNNVLQSPKLPQGGERAYIPGCGKRNPGGIGVTFLGFQDRQAQYGEFPWMAAVRSPTRGNHEDDFYVFGGSLIHPGAVLTVAHHASRYQPHDLVVRLGEWNFNSNTESLPHEDVGIRRIILHPQYSSRTLHYDWALLILDRQVQLQQHIDTICLPDFRPSFVNHRCYSSGWGTLNFQFNSKYEKILKKLKVPIIDNHQCENNLRNTRLGQSFNLHRTFICAGGEGIDTCKGDGGSPLVCHSPVSTGKYMQVGAAAWGIGCGTIGVPGVYADVQSGISWIRNMINIIFGAGNERYFTS